MARFGALGGRGEGREVGLRQSRMAEAGELVAVLVEGDHRGDHRIVRGGEFDIGAFDGVRLVPADAAGRVVGDQAGPDRKSVVSGKSVSVRVDLGGRRVNKKKT